MRGPRTRDHPGRPHGIHREEGITIGEVIDLFGAPPIAQEDEKIATFVEDHLMEFIGTVQMLDSATTRDEFNDQIEEVRRLVAQWPRRL